MIDRDGVRFCVVCDFKRVMTDTEKQVVKHPSINRLYDNTPILACEHHGYAEKVKAYKRNLHLLCIDQDMIGQGVDAIRNTIARINERIQRVRGNI
jgi:hypothetical protein